MFILDSLMISGIRWALETALTAAEAEMNDDSVLREQLIETELRREMGELSDEEFQAIEADLLARIREIRNRRGATGPLEMGVHPMETTGDSRFQVEASVSGDFYDPADAPHTTVVESTPRSGEEITVLDMDERSTSGKGAKGARGSTSRTRTPRTLRTPRTPRTLRTPRTPK
jgi:hypothetical protein